MDTVKGGLADKLSLKDIADYHKVSLEVLKNQFAKGLEVELEHTSDRKVAGEIAKDHLYEDPEYYSKLAMVEVEDFCEGCLAEFMLLHRDSLEEAEHRGKKVKLGKPFRTPQGPKKFSVYVKKDNGNVVKVNFGDPKARVKNSSKGRAKSFLARHNCDQKKDRTTAGYWSCNINRYRKQLGLKSSDRW